MDSFSFKDFENVRLKATYNMKIGDREFVEGETLAVFDKIQIAGLSENVKRVQASGGFDNRARVFWETTQEERLTFSQGIFNKLQFALLSNANVIDINEEDAIEVTFQESLESDENGRIVLKYTPTRDLFIYDIATGAKISNFTSEDNLVTIETPFLNVSVIYVYNYTNGGKVFKIGQRLFNGFVSLEGQTRVKDDTTGQVVTGLIKIPHLKLMSDMSIRLGAQANPVVANFAAVGVPVGSRGNTYVSEFYYLSDDIHSDL